jgi:xanthine dehydrogenase accessory factor
MDHHAPHLGMHAQELHAEIARLLQAGERVAVATVIRGRGSHPREAGAKMLVRSDGSTLGSVGGGALEASVIADCGAALASGDRRTTTYDLSEAGPHSVGMTCGGSVDVFVDVLEPAARLFVFGAGHVGRALAQAASLVGLALTVVDDRADWLQPEAFPRGAALHRCNREYAADLPDVPATALAAVMTRCHATDIAVLRHLARTPPRYTGMIGSRRKVLRAYRVLEGQGVERAWLDTIRAPIGLRIGAETPAEIAIAVVAEIVQLLREGATAEAPAEQEVDAR